MESQANEGFVSTTSNTYKLTWRVMAMKVLSAIKLKRLTYIKSYKPIKVLSALQLRPINQNRE